MDFVQGIPVEYELDASSMPSTGTTSCHPKKWLCRSERNSALDTLAPVTRKVYFYPRTGLYFRTCEDGAGWHLIPYRISPRSEFFSQAYKTWHITWGINLGPDWPPLARGSKFHTIHTPTRSLSFLPPRQWKIWTSRLRSNNIIL